MEGEESARNTTALVPIEVEVDHAFADISKNLNLTSFSLTPKEAEILELYDTLKELRLESVLLEAQISQSKASSPDLTAEQAESQLKEAEKEHLDARAAYMLQDNIVKNVVQADSLLKAVHSGSNASPMERAIHPLIDQRDVLSIVQTNLSARHQAASDSLMSTRVEIVRVRDESRSLARTILERTANDNEDPGGIEDPDFQEELGELRARSTTEKRQYRIMKSLISAIVAGSGFDWSQDEELRELVMDAED